MEVAKIFLIEFGAFAWHLTKWKVREIKYWAPSGIKPIFSSLRDATTQPALFCVVVCLVHQSCFCFLLQVKVQNMGPVGRMP